MDDVRTTRKSIPVLIGNDTHVMASADIYRTPEKVMIQISAGGIDGQMLAEFLEQAEPIALSFGAIPVQNITEKRDNI